MKKKKLDIDSILQYAPVGPSRWELDNIVWNDRTTNPKTLVEFLQRIKVLQTAKDLLPEHQRELEILEELAEDLDIHAC